MRKSIQDMQTEFNIDWRKHYWDNTGNENFSKPDMSLSRKPSPKNDYEGQDMRVWAQGRGIRSLS